MQKLICITLTQSGYTVFQQLEVDYVIGHPNKDVQSTDLAEVPIIRMYGVTESGADAATAEQHASSLQGLWLAVPHHCTSCRKQCVCFRSWV